MGARGVLLHGIDTADEMAARMGLPRVFVLTDVRLYAEGLVHILEREPSIDVIGTSHSPSQAMDAIFERSVEVVLLDLQAPAGPEVARMIRDAAPDVWLVALAVPEGDDDIVAWAEAGIAGVLPRDGSFKDLVVIDRQRRPRGDRLLAASGRSAAPPGRRARQNGRSVIGRGTAGFAAHLT